MIAKDEMREDAYCTLLTNDKYLPGALVLAHSLKDANTRKKLAIIVTGDVGEDARSQVKQLFDHVIDVDNITNSDPSNLGLMGRADLASTFTKISIWKQVHFRKIVFLDADTLCLRAPDELFDVDAAFAAAPEAGWPDAFNSGVLVVEPSLAVFEDLFAMAEAAKSFDGGDQGLLNLYFRDYHRLSFQYNVTTFKTYHLYMPALTHYQDKISVIHFTGAEKPWHGKNLSDEQHAYGDFYNWTLEHWWAIHEKHQDSE